MPVSAETVLHAAADGDEVALELIDEIGRRFARVAVTLNLLLDPQLLVFAGAVAEDGEIFLSAIRRHVPALLERMDAPPSTTAPRIEASRLGDQVVVTGAVRLALDLVACRCLDAEGAPIRPAPGYEEVA